VAIEKSRKRNGGGANGGETGALAAQQPASEAASATAMATAAAPQEDALAEARQALSLVARTEERGRVLHRRRRQAIDLDLDPSAMRD